MNAVGTGAPESEDTLYATSPANIASLTDVVTRNPNDPQAYNMRGSVFGQAGRYDKALADFDKAIGIDANYAQAYANRGLVYREDRQIRPRARRLQQGDPIRTTRWPISAAAWSTAQKKRARL